jgi:predicted membrane channel-forming protein YqfA (hemolysin III family)
MDLDMIDLKKPKEKFDKYSTRGIVYAGIALVGISYEFLFSSEVRPFLIIMYSLVIVIGVLYIWYIKPVD